MNPSDNVRAKQYLEVLQAYFAGKEIEIDISKDRDQSQWQTCIDPWFTSPMKDYRIKAEPATTKFRLYKSYNATSKKVDILSIPEYTFLNVWDGYEEYLPGFQGWVGDWQVYTFEE